LIEDGNLGSRLKSKLFSLIFLILFWPGLVYSQDTGSIFDTGSERIGYYQKEGNRIDIFDRSWEREGYIILND
jgi:hypothetical protein